MHGLPGLISFTNRFLEYHTNPRAIASTVLAWPGWVFTVAGCVIPFNRWFEETKLTIRSTVILFMSQRHDDQYGPKSGYGRRLEDGAVGDGAAGDVEDKRVPSV